MTETSPEQPAKRPSGRRTGNASTREALLKAAVETFAENGFEGSTLRAITSKAGVDVALVSHFFGNKQGLFDEAVLRQSEQNLQRVISFTPGDEPARQLLEIYLDMWENPATALTVRALFRAAFESEDNRARLQALISETLKSGLQVMAEQRGPAALAQLEHDPELASVRTQLLGAHLLGIGISRYIMQISPLADLSREELLAQLVPIVEAYLP